MDNDTPRRCESCRRPLGVGDYIGRHADKGKCIIELKARDADHVDELRAIRSAVSKMIDDHGKSLDVGATNSLMAIHERVERSLARTA